jgi:hypothetical protein
LPGLFLLAVNADSNASAVPGFDHWRRYLRRGTADSLAVLPIILWRLPRREVNMTDPLVTAAEDVKADIIKVKAWYQHVEPYAMAFGTFVLGLVLGHFL